MRKCTCILLVDDHDEVSMNHQQTSLNIEQTHIEQTIKQTHVIQEIVSPEVSELNHVVRNKKQGDYIVFSGKKDKKKEGFIYFRQRIIAVDGLYYKMGNRFISCKDFYL